MKQYIITEQDIERLKDKLITEDFIIDKWAETLNTLDTTKVRTIIAPKVNTEDYVQNKN